jgi:hypothetical protein
LLIEGPLRRGRDPPGREASHSSTELSGVLKQSMVIIILSGTIMEKISYSDHGDLSPPFFYILYISRH